MELSCLQPAPPAMLMSLGIMLRARSVGRAQFWLILCVSVSLDFTFSCGTNLNAVTTDLQLGSLSFFFLLHCITSGICFYIPSLELEVHLTPI